MDVGLLEPNFDDLWKTDEEMICRHCPLYDDYCEDGYYGCEQVCCDQAEINYEKWHKEYHKK